MKSTFFKRVGGRVRRSLRRGNTKTVVISEAVPQPKADNVAKIMVNEPSVVMSAGKRTGQARYFLLKDSKLVGKSPNNYHPEIRIIHINSLVDAFLLFLRMCNQHLLTYRRTGEHPHCTAVFPDGGRNLYFTNGVACRNKKNTVAALKIDYMSLKPGISEAGFGLNIRK